MEKHHVGCRTACSPHIASVRIAGGEAGRELLPDPRDFDHEADLDHAPSLPDARAMLRQKSYNLVLFEYETADAVALDLLSEFLHCGLSVPFILLAEDADEATIANILQAG